MREQKGNNSQEANVLTEISHPHSSSPRDELHSSELLSSKVAYNELADVPVQFVDPVLEVQKNMAHLMELQARMKFMMREVRYLLKL